MLSNCVHVVTNADSGDQLEITYQELPQMAVSRLKRYGNPQSRLTFIPLFTR